MGLAISRTIVEAHQGGLAMEPRASGRGDHRAIGPPARGHRHDDADGLRGRRQRRASASRCRRSSRRRGLRSRRTRRPRSSSRPTTRRGRAAWSWTSASAGESGLDLQDELRRRHVTLPIIVMTGYGDVPTSVRAFKGGAVDFLREARAAEEAARARSARPSRSIGGPATRRRSAPPWPTASRELTPRERQVMELLAVGKSSKEIAAALRHQRAHGGGPSARGAAKDGRRLRRGVGSRHRRSPADVSSIPIPTRLRWCRDALGQVRRCATP